MTIVDESTRALVRPDAAQVPERYIPPPVTRLSTLSPTGLDTSNVRILPQAIVSLGTKVKDRRKDGTEYERPRAAQPSDERWFSLAEPYGEAPGIRAALDAGKWRHLTITFGSDDPNQVRSQLLTRWAGNGTLEAWGTETALKVVYRTDQQGNLYRDEKGKEKPRILVLSPFSDSPKIRQQFALELASCQVETRFYFTLAVWEMRDGRPYSRLIYPDGYGFYAFRTTSEPTVALLDGYIQQILERTGGQLKDVPLELEAFFMNRHSGDGLRRTVPTVKLSFKPPMGTLVDARELRRFIIGGLAEGRLLERPTLPSPDQLMLEAGQVESLVPEMTDEQAHRLQEGFVPCEYNATLKTFMAIIAGTPLAADEGHQWLRSWSAQRFGESGVLTSRRQFRNLSYVDASEMLADLAVGVADLRATGEIPNGRREPAPAPNTEPQQPPRPARRAQTAAQAEIVDDRAAVEAAKPAVTEEENEEELLALARGSQEPGDMIAQDSTEGRAHTARMAEAKSLGLPTGPCEVSYPAQRALVIERTMRLSRLITSMQQTRSNRNDPQQGVEPSPKTNAAKTSDEDGLGDLPF